MALSMSVLSECILKPCSSEQVGFCLYLNDKTVSAINIITSSTHTYRWLQKSNETSCVAKYTT